ncbi:hypothetical protein [Actinophytocola xanthii]|uniref:Thioredoxin domain-containing protein n=1 Tax=Actinophytocola xanthii TaxID=1912961 RepID=A0A1Q8CXP3_9PSEU|nr:hypothetical protein [Actinophytocola xanthii]OLF19125.1 hypothetical protein BU204_01770 [Actinophytocola xanthii]
MSFQTSALIVTWVALLLLALVVSGLVRQVHALSSGTVRHTARSGARPGTGAPDLDRLGTRLPAVLLFLSPTCHTCTEVLEETAGEVGDRIPVHALYEGAAPDPPPAGVTVHPDQGDLFAAYGALATPFAVLVDDDGRIGAAAPVGSRAAVRELLDPVRTR